MSGGAAAFDDEVTGVTARTAAAAGATAVALGSTVALGPLAEPLAGRVGAPAPLVLPVALGLALVAGVLTGPLAQRHGHRPLLLTAAPLMVTGLLGLGCSGGWMALPAAAAVGIGAGCVLVPVLVAVGSAGPAGAARARDHLGRRSGRQRGAAAAGRPVGRADRPARLPDRARRRVGRRAARLGRDTGPARLGFRAAPSCAGSTIIGTAPRHGVARLGRAAAAQGRLGARRDGAAPGDRTAGFGQLYVGSVASSCAVFLPIGQLAPYAAEHRLGLPFATAMISTMSLVGLLGRVSAGLLAARVGAEAGLQAGALGLVAGLGMWWAVDPHPALVFAFAVVFGLAHGGYVALLPAVVAARYPADGLGARLGVLYTAAALGGVLGPLTAATVTAELGTTGPAIALGALAAAAGWLLLRRPAHRR